ncbi:hypothetical protein R6Q57_006076 [Mikania cordata]
MEKQHDNITKSPHVLLLPFPAQGHINPIIQFGKRLISKGVKTTLITTIFFLNSHFTNKTNTTSIEIEAISDGFDEGGEASADSPESYLKTFKEVGSRSLADLIKKLLSRGKTIDAIIYDPFMTWPLDVALDFGIKGGSFFTQACGVNIIYYHVHKGLISLPLGPTTVSVPGLPPLERWETPSYVHNYGPYPGWSKAVFGQFANIDQARWVFTTSFYQFEKEVIEWMRKKWKLMAIGPTLPSMYLDKRLEDDKDYGFNLYQANHSEYIDWLNDKPKKSVVYVSFGSIAKLGHEQMEEIAWGLTDSDVNFLWVVRAEEEEKLPKEFVDKILTRKGMVVAWCRQLDVLSHESVGCFVTHCGYNSTLEAISLGVPVVGMPQWTDQITNAKFLEEIWDIGVRVKSEENGIMRRENLVSCIKTIMKEERGVIARRNAIKWKDLAKLAIDEGGSSDKDIDEFKQDNNTNKPPYVLVIPFPAQGHINPLIQFAKRLISKGVKTTLITTIFYLNSQFTNKTNTTSIEIEAISDGFDVGGYSSADSSEAYLKRFKEVGSRSLAELIRKLQNEGNTIDAIIYDSFMTWVLDVALEFGINGGSFFTQACGVNSIYYHVHKGLISLPPGPTVLVPGLPRLERWETPSFVHDLGPYPGWSETVFGQFANIDQARWVFTNSFYQLEEEVIEWMRKKWKLMAIGPTLPSMYLDKRLENDKDYGFNLYQANHNEYTDWLNDKPKKSVVYISFGSSAKLEPEQMEEIAWGLSDSDVNFLWVVRVEEEEKFPKEFMAKKLAGKGMVVAWCRQLEVLAHESVGCFITHCGYNSTLEAISLGVPVVGMPQWTDQITNAKFLEDIWDVGVRVKADENGIVRRENIASCVKTILKEERGVIAQRNALKWRDLAKLAVDEGGSSDKDIVEFVYELTNA